MECVVLKSSHHHVVWRNSMRLFLFFSAFLAFSVECFTPPQFTAVSPSRSSNIQWHRNRNRKEKQCLLHAYSTRQVTSNDLLNIASFRNNCTSPELMIQKQNEKNDSFNKIDSMKDGVVIGLGVGLTFSLLSGLSEDNWDAAFKTFLYVGPILSILLGLNNLLGKRVYVMTLPQAENRLVVDFVAGLKSGQDIGFIAKVPPEKSRDPIMFQQTNGIVGSVDCQKRPSKGILPPHVYVKNVFVHECMRRCGVASALLRDVEIYCKYEKCEMVVLEVDDSNTAAVEFYENSGYSRESISNPVQSKKYGTSWV